MSRNAGLQEEEAGRMLNQEVTSRRLCALSVALIAVLGLSSAGGRGARGAAGECPSLPPSFEEHVVFYASFDRQPPLPEVNAIGAGVPGDVPTGPDGIRGRCFAIRKKGAYVVRSPALSPHRALTLSFWWALGKDADLESAFQLFSLEGRGYVSNFVRGKGEWCALDRPAFVFQVQNFPAIPNVNGIYDRNPLAKGALKAGLWRHTVLTAAAGRSLNLYMDGALVCQVDTRSRPLTPDDGIAQLALGNRHGDFDMLLDEVVLLHRVLSPEEIEGYHTALRRMHEAGYP